MKRSTLALIGSLMGLMYLAYLICLLIWAENPAALSFQLGALTFKVAWLLPHAALVAAAVLLNWIQWLARKRGAGLASALLYAASSPLMQPLFAVPLALALIALAGFIWPGQKKEKVKGSAAEDPALEMLSGAADEEEPDLDDLDDLDDPAGPEAAEDEPELALEDGPDDDPQLDLDEKKEPPRPRADGMAVFLGVFMVVVALALIGLVILGLMGVKLPFMR